MAYEYKIQPVSYVDQKGYHQTRMESVLTYNPNSVLAGTAAGEAIVQERQSQSWQSKPCCWILVTFFMTIFALVVSGIILAVILL
jgi:hypothetical protein